MSKLHIEDVDPGDKALWVACASHSGRTLAEWITAAANEAAKRNPPPPPKWMREAGFSERLSDALLRAGYKDPDVLSGCLRCEPDDHWIYMENFGRRCLQELKEKWPV